MSDRTLVTAVLTEGGKTVLRERRFRLSERRDGAKPRLHDFAGPSVTIGASQNCDITLDAKGVSRFHARIEVVDGSPRVRDLGSTNGTFVNGLRIGEAWLPERASLQLGESVVDFEIRPESDTIELFGGDRLGRLRGASIAMRRLFAILDRLARTEATALLTGETGTGKELAAESIHERSARSAHPFVVVDCGALPANLIESELFGHERGAFTGAVVARAGAFEVASGGTIFLDEIGELDLSLQPRLLRVLESGKIKRLGSQQYRPVDVRILAATHRDLAAMVTSGDFREDLYYRLAVVTARMPPLRHRRGDIAPLAGHFLQEAKRRTSGRDEFELSPQTLRALEARAWPGNVRELRNCVERILVLAGDFEDPSAVDHSDTSAVPQGKRPELDASFASAKDAVISEFERDFLRRALNAAGGNVAQAARSIRLDRAHFFRLMRKYELRRGD